MRNAELGEGQAGIKIFASLFISDTQFSSVAQSCPTLCDPMDCSTAGFLSISNSWSLLRLMPIKLVMLSSLLILCCPFLLLLSIFPSIRVFYGKSSLHIRWPKYWSFSISPSNAYLGLVSFRIDWFDLLAVQGTLKTLFHRHNSKALILWHSAWFMVQLSHLYVTTGKTVALTRWTFVSKVRLVWYLKNSSIPFNSLNEEKIVSINIEKLFDKSHDSNKHLLETWKYRKFNQLGEEL